MEFRTPVHIPPLRTRIDYSRRGLLLGSCFAENIAARMLGVKLPVVANPFGVLYNPASVARAVEYLAEGRRFTSDDLHTDGNLWFSYAHHGRFSAPDPDTALAEMNRQAAAGSEALRRAGYVVLTLGTAWIYERDGAVVANCHKQPAAHFTRRRMSVEEVVATLSETISRHLQDKDILLTVSPVRHIKDGLAENARSKAILIEACHRLTESLPRTEYFPAYEILTDELRDYRFYAADMLHPSEVAADYVWDRFCESAVDAPVRELMRQAGQIAQAAAHRPLHPGTEAFARFRETMAARARALRQAHPEIDLAAEIAFFETP